MKRFYGSQLRIFRLFALRNAPKIQYPKQTKFIVKTNKYKIFAKKYLTNDGFSW